MDKYINFKIDNKTVVHATTEKDAIKLCKLLDKLGATWGSGNRYTEYLNWEYRKNNTCYDVHYGCFESIKVYKKHGYEIISVEHFLKLHKQSTSIRFFEKLKRIFSRIFSRVFSRVFRRNLDEF